ncbi:splicing factor 3B subunit 2 [Drosophila rhopaloa]|uniref:PSP proline-rich domain-containing protein n=1 Tax=Drosophila rhopaloa TaxID=1041015 RepID=A0ABM5HZH3_DRORH|nr:splicing factor 3B subunit 2 [Drosophila rhopaloa]
MADQVNNEAGQPTPLMSIRFDQQQHESAAANGNENGNGSGNAAGEASEDGVETEKSTAELVLPKALEDVLALKDQRAAEFTVDADSQGGSGGVTQDGDEADVGEDSEEDADNQVNGGDGEKAGKQSKAERNKKKKKRKKLNKKIRHQLEFERQQQLAQADEHEVVDQDAKEQETKAPGSGDEQAVEKEKKDKHKESRSKRRKDRSDEKEKDKKTGDSHEEDVTIEYVPEKITIADLAPMYRQFYRVFEIFKLENKPKPAEKDKSSLDPESLSKDKKAADKLLEDEDDDGDDDDEHKEDKEKLSKRKLKKLTRLSVAELKQLVSRPDVVEMHDVTARDPKLLVQLKAYRNTVQVPRHWCFKRKYLQGKRGIEKPPFDLPAFIKKTGIMEMRESLQEREDAKTLKAKMRERVRPKMGKIDIDYQKLHDAFFKWQTKPRMTIHGDLYYEGKEFETRLKEKKPGDLSEELRIALGMPVGPNSHKIPPPWLIAQQRYGPPPSYPNLKIPGLNAPIPDGTSFGYHAGGWGKPPVDENGKPLYGDVFGTNILDLDNGIDEADIERNQWGELESESEESSEEEEEDGEDLGDQQDETGLVTPVEGLVTPSGLTSVPAGMETPENIELRKKKIEAEMEDNETPVLYQVLPEKRTDRIGASMMGSTHVYDVSGSGANKQPAVRSTTDREGIVELALDPSELDMDNDAMAQRYEQQMREQQNHLQKEDLSDMLAEHVARQKSKRKRQQTDPAKTTKKYKEFKF